jgi:hypothetical protein
MSVSDWIALGQLIVSALSLLVAVTAGILAILGYRKIIKSTDDNAKERQEAIDKAATILQDMGGNFIGSIKRDKYTITGFMVVMILGFFWVGQLVFKVGDRVKKVEQKERQG